MKRSILAAMLIIRAFFGAYGQDSTPIDLILLLDTSSNMGSSYETVSGYITGGFLSEYLRIGDTFHLISFSDTPRFDAARRIQSRGDVETIIGRMLLQYPMESASNIRAAINYAEDYASALPSRPKKIVLVSSGGSDTDAIVSAAKQRLGSKNSTLDFILVAPGQPLSNLPNSGRPAATGTTAAVSAPAVSAAQSSASAAGTSTSTTTITQSQTQSQTPSSSTQAASTSTAVTGGGTTSGAASGTQAGTGSSSTAASSTTGTGTSGSNTANASSTASQTQEASTSGTSTSGTGAASTSANSGTGPQVQQDASSSANTAGGSVSASDNRQSETAGATETDSRYAESKTSGESSSRSDGAFSVPLIIALILLALLVLGLIIFFSTRNLRSSPNRVMAQAASTDSKTKAKPKEKEKTQPADNSKHLATFAAGQNRQRTSPYSNRSVQKDDAKPAVINPSGPLLLNLFVEDQNTNIGKRNIHSLKSGYSLKVGGGKSDDFLIFLVPMPANIGEIRRNGSQCTFVPHKEKYFPDIGSSEVRDCINKTIRVVSDKNYEMRFRFEMYEDPLVALNQMLNSVRVPG